MNFKALFVLGPLFMAAAAFAETTADTFPARIVCEMPALQSLPEGKAVFYLSAFTDEGEVLYQSLGAQVGSILFSSDGTQKPPDSKKCGGKTLPELIEDGG